ncbi:F0F1 ATP synthase subunit epsilon [Sphingomonas adhaesiva]|jgi:F-type H+-transporting ATPase subunit epsilon|uniref:F0F1 ATP synthase subunit epsilon n=1 Tax=Sphingomonas adhaesiva TaxID=28212 RepID=A0A2A4I1T3_9SPHN|nr:F0F1 ATP synthase subunit epsilon [Sphingomonas adhaesiva]PCG12947.1 F0F1 ATP synthase subunit epsilon [Sphingomonas adhaesiva]
MKLRIADPTSIVVDREVASVRAEDASGSFGILPRHADFLTVLEISVVAWREVDGTPNFCAVRNGVLTVLAGEVEIVTREAHVSADLNELEMVVLAGYREHLDAERASRTSAAKLRTQAIRRMVEALQGGPAELGL